ncbi:ATP-binding protein [Streptomyces sp. NPDC037389]|uniref:ATP-binding protein n=1 Tax=Streptomyces sp. NPDC037389 TaxID=3155369 RepID=UPI0033F3B582
MAIGVAPHERAVAGARHTLRETLASWGNGSEDDIGSAELVASELLTNALRHASRHDIALTASEAAGALLIEVEDGGSPVSAPAVRRVVADDAVCGRGLFIVNAVADMWSWRELPHGGRGTWALLSWPGEAAQ